MPSSRILGQNNGNLPKNLSLNIYRKTLLHNTLHFRSFQLYLPFSSQLMNTLNRHLVVLIDALYSQMTNFVSELEEYENFDEKTGRPNLSLKKNKEPPSEPVVQCRKLKVLLNFLSRRVTQVIEVAGDNWTELKYMLQLLCLHPDSEGLEVEIDNDYEGIIREQDFELLIKVSIHLFVLFILFSVHLQRALLSFKIG